MSTITIPFKSTRIRARQRKEDHQRHTEKLHPARVATWLALAHKVEAHIKAGTYENMTECAQAHELTVARMSCITTLLLLAPDIQEQVIQLQTRPGKEPMSERELRDVARLLVWSDQREAFARLMRRAEVPDTPRGASCNQTPTEPIIRLEHKELCVSLFADHNIGRAPGCAAGPYV